MGYCIECGDETEVCFCGIEKKPMTEYISTLKECTAKVLLQKVHPIKVK